MCSGRRNICRRKYEKRRKKMNKKESPERGRKDSF
jgi:hypothetical protein